MSTTAHSPEASAVLAIEQVGHRLRQLGGFVDVSTYTGTGAEEARAAIRPMLGRVIVGNIDFNSYYDFRPKERPVYQQQLLEQHPYSGNDFRGILTGLINIQIPIWRPDQDPKRFCLRIAPLAKYVDKDWQHYYRQRGWDAMLNHPFAQADKARRSVWIPVNTIREKYLHFPGIPEDSAPVPRYRRGF